MSEWVNILKRAWKYDRKFDITEMTDKSFLIMNDLCGNVVNRKINESDEKVN